ncbi:conserved membrane protein of unknown function [Nitrospira moscoviensis]|uniref:TMEM205-like domain-containing protein n=2 Tax=Nitrospira moscoviensis TaxID=42253 RepID=A0A0K2GFI5_NITMO|nr:conserved membrane protein of unknown function [Nitrospira moscoviensis]
MLVISLMSEWVALGIWIGGLVVLIAAVLPAVFNTFGGQDAGGLFLTKAFEGYNRLVLGAIVVLAAGMGWRAWNAPLQYAVGRGEALLFAAMVLIAGVIIFYLHPLAAARQAEAFALKAGEGRKEAFEAFFKLHMPVRSLYLINLGLGLFLAGARVRTWIRRSEGVV